MPKRALLSIAVILLAAAPLIAEQLPIIFVHGNGDSSALWHTTIWRFESNGYDRSLLFAVNMIAPAARNDDAKPQENRSSTIDQASQLSAEVTRVLLSTGKKKVILVGNSRGGYPIRNYIANAGGAVNVAKAILCGVPNHGVVSLPNLPAMEFNGQGKFLSGLNAENEVPPGVEFMTIRSDKNDKYAQPVFAGRPSGVTYESPELRGAKNVVLPDLDHRETAFSAPAFEAMYTFITGSKPATLEIVPEEKPSLNGMVDGYVSGAFTNLPAAGVTVAIYEVDRETGKRLGDAVHTRTTGADGLWGPFVGKPTAYYEFVFHQGTGATYHIYRTPFPRSSGHVGLRLRPTSTSAGEGAVVTLIRPRGYLGVGRDKFLIDGKIPEGVLAGVATNDSASLKVAAMSSVRVDLNKESLTVIAYPTAEGHVVIAEFHY